MLISAATVVEVTWVQLRCDGDVVSRNCYFEKSASRSSHERADFSGAHPRSNCEIYRQHLCFSEMRSVFLFLLALLFFVGCRSRVQEASVDPVSASDAVTVTDVRFPSKSIDDI